MKKKTVSLFITLFLYTILFSNYTAANTACTIQIGPPGEIAFLTDTDCDGIPNTADEGYTADNCPYKPNGELLGTCLTGTKAGETCSTSSECGDNSTCSMNQEDTDTDGTGDACDFCEGPGAFDTDDDGICDNDDNCPGISNPDQADWNGDGYGNVCTNGLEKTAPIEHFSGSWQEIGRQVGQTFADNIISFGNIMKLVLNAVGPGNGWTPQTYYDATVEWIPRSIQDHLQGMALGLSEVRSISYTTAWDLVLTQNFAVELINMGKNMSKVPEVDLFGCTAFGVVSDQGSFLSHNTDAMSMGYNTSVIMYWEPSNGDYAYITMDPPGWADVAFGLNEKGLAVTMNAGNPNTAAAMGMYSNFLIRYAMEHASTLEEAVGMFEDHLDNGSSFGPTGAIIHFMDFNQNTMAKIQLRSEEIEVTYGQQSQNGATYIGSANHFVGDFNPDPEYYYESSDERYKRLMVLMEETKNFDKNGCWSVMSDTNGGEPNNNTISRKGTFATSSTVFGTIFTKDGLYYALGMPHEYLDEYNTPQFVKFSDPTDNNTNEICPAEKILGRGHKALGLLRWFRDEVLMKSKTGIEIVNLYYKLSPLITDRLEDGE